MVAGGCTMADIAGLVENDCSLDNATTKPTNAVVSDLHWAESGINRVCAAKGTSSGRVKHDPAASTTACLTE